jgi:ClpP class serine protease
MINSIHQRRGIPIEELKGIKSKIMHPRDALRLKLIDSVGTFEEFKDLNFPNTSVEKFTYRIEGFRIGHRFTSREMNAITTFFELLEMPQVALFSNSDPLVESMSELLKLLEGRLQSGEGLDSLDSWLSELFESKVAEPYRGLRFEI